MSELATRVQEQVAEAVSDGLAVMRGEPGKRPGTPIHGITFGTGLATAPVALERRAFGLAAALVVPPGTSAVVFLPGGERRLFTAGSYVLWDIQPGGVLAQWVDMRRQQVPIGPVEGYSADKWRVRLWLTIAVEVNDPVRIAAHREPLVTLTAAARTGALRYIEQHTHAALTGCADSQGGMDAPADEIAERLRQDPALEGMSIISVRVVERQGDERQIEAATVATVTAAQIDEELRVADARNRARLHELSAHAQIAEREHHLRMAAVTAAAREQLLAQQSEVQQAALAARLDIVMAQIRAQTSEIAREEQLWQSEQARLQGEWERVQRQLVEVHQTDQQLRLMEAQQGVLRSEGELALAAEDRRNAHTLALAEIQQRLADQRALQSQAMAERRQQHERALLDLHLRHEQLIAEQMQQIEHWRTQQVQSGIQQQRQHERQMAVIGGTARIAAAAAGQPALPQTQAEPASGPLPAVADSGLRALQELAE